MNDTIIALATPQGSGAIAVIRLSGTQAIEVVDKIFFSKKKLENLTSQSVVFGTIKKEDEIKMEEEELPKLDGAPIDENTSANASKVVANRSAFSIPLPSYQEIP